MALGTGPLTTTDASTQSGAGEEIREIEAAAPRRGSRVDGTASD